MARTSGILYFSPAVIVWAHIVATFLMRFVPVSVAYRLVGLFTPLALLFAPGYVRRARENMRQVLGNAASTREVRRLTTAAFANYARYMVDLIRLPSVDGSTLGKDVEVHGWEHVDAAYALGKGVVFATGHIGSWDIAGAAFIARGRSVSVLVETLSPPRWNERVQAIRRHVGMVAIPIESGVRDMLAALRRNEGLEILVDRPVPDGVPVTFFGRRTQVPGGAAALARRTGAAIVPVAFLRDASHRGYVAQIGAPILPTRGANPNDDVQDLMQQIMSWLEGAIRRHPDQWYMFRRMWPAAAASAPHLEPLTA